MSNNNIKSKTVNKSVVQKLKTDNKINDETLVALNTFTIEDLIAIKLELSANNLNNRLYGLDIWKKSDYIIKDAILKGRVHWHEFTADGIWEHETRKQHLKTKK